MKCPHCHHISDKALLKCSSCQTVFDREVLERLQHLDYLLDWLEAQAKEGDLARYEQAAATKNVMVQAALEQRAKVRRELHLDQEEVAAALPEAVPEVEVVTAEEVTPVPEKTPVVEVIAAEETTVSPPPTPEPQPEITPPAPPLPRLPALQPTFNWGNMWEKVVESAVSGALLRGLLYLGAFMIVFASGVLVIRFWDAFPQIAQLGFIAAVPTAFYLAGWLVRGKLALPQAGGVLTGVGALLVAVDFAAVYQFGDLADRINGGVYWLGAAVFCTAVYALTTWRLPTEFFGYATYAGLTNVLVALAFVLRLPPAWPVAAVAATAVILVGVALRWRQTERWRELARAAQRLAIVLLPLSQATVLFVAGDWGKAVTYALAALAYGWLGWRLTAPVLAHAAVWSSAAAVGLGVWAASLPGEWYATAAALIAPVYTLAGYRLGLDPDAPRQSWRTAGYIAGIGLLGLATVAGLLTLPFDLWPGVIALALTAVTLTGHAWLLRQPLFLLAGSGLFILPYSIATTRWLWDGAAAQWAAWLAAAWAGLALAYLSVGLALRAHERYGRWLNLWAHLLAPAAVLLLVGNYGLTLDDWFAGPTLLALAGVIALYVISAVAHDNGRFPSLSSAVNQWLPGWPGYTLFLWPPGFLLPLWVTFAWLGSSLLLEWLGLALAALGLAYVGLGQLLARRHADYRRPPHAYAYLAPAVAILVAWGDSWALLATLLAAVVVLAALAFIYGRVLETGAAALLFIWPFQLALQLSPLTPHAYALAYALLACLGYLPLSLAINSRRRLWPISRPRHQARSGDRPEQLETGGLDKRALAIAGIGYFLALLAVVLSLLGRFDVYPLDVAWIGAATPLLVTGLALFSLYRFRVRPFAWAGVVLAAITFGQTLTLLRVPAVYDATAWVTLAIAAMLAERALTRAVAAGWQRLLRLPLASSAVIFAGLGLLLTVPDTLLALSGRETAGVFPLILAQALAVLLTVLAARLYRSRWPLYLEPALLFWPVTLFFAGYGARLLGQPLAPAEYSLVWLALGLLHLTAAIRLDRSPIRYAHGSYAGGYGLVLWALIWSLSDPLLNVVVLGTAVLVAAASQWLVHAGRHHTFDDLTNRLWGTTASPWQRAGRISFLFFAAYAFPVWLGQLLAILNVPLAWRGLALAMAAPVYVGLGLWLRRSRAEYTWPFYSAGYALTVMGAMVAFDDQRLAIATLSLNTLVYAASAYIFRQPFWLYLSNGLVPLIVLLALDYADTLTAPWMAGFFMGLAFVYVGIGRWFDGRQPEPGGIASFAWPFYAPGYLLSVVALVVAIEERTLMVVIHTAGVALYGLSALLFRRPRWLYPALLAAHLAWGAFVGIGAAGTTLNRSTLPFHGLTWALALAGYGLTRQAVQEEKRPALARLLTPSWGQPFLILAALDVVVWQIVVLAATGTAVILAIGHTLLLGLLATLWQDRALPYGSLVFLLLATGYGLADGGVALAPALTWFGGAALGLYLLSRLVGLAPRLLLWRQPLARTAFFVSALTVTGSLPLVVTVPTTAALTLALAGSLALAHAYVSGARTLGYLGMGLWQLAWVLLLIDRGVGQPQLYAIPAGLYLVGMGVLERRNGRILFANYLEAFGLALLLLTSFIQSLNGAAGFPYFLLLLAEGIVVVWWGAMRRCRVAFFMGLGGSVLNILAQIVVLVNVYDINRWLVTLAAGLLLIVTAVFVERKREQIIAQTREWREAMGEWQ